MKKCRNWMAKLSMAGLLCLCFSNAAFGWTLGRSWGISEGNENFHVTQTTWGGCFTNYAFSYQGLIISGGGTMSLNECGINSHNVAVNVTYISRDFFGAAIPIGFYNGIMTGPNSFEAYGIKLDGQVRTLHFH